MTTDLAPYRQDIEVQHARADLGSIAEQAAALAIVDGASNMLALDMLNGVRKAAKRIEGLRARWLDPLNAQIKLIRADFDAMLSPAREADLILADKIARYRHQLALAAQAEQDRLRALADKRQERAEARAAERGLEPPPPPFMPLVPAPAKTVVTESGSKITYRKTLHFEVVDESLVPREFWVIDQAKLGAVVRSGLSPIPGVRIWETEEPVVR